MGNANTTATLDALPAPAAPTREGGDDEARQRAAARAGAETGEGHWVFPLHERVVPSSSSSPHPAEPIDEATAVFRRIEDYYDIPAAEKDVSSTTSSASCLPLPLIPSSPLPFPLPP